MAITLVPVELREIHLRLQIRVVRILKTVTITVLG